MLVHVTRHAVWHLSASRPLSLQGYVKNELEGTQCLEHVGQLTAETHRITATFIEGTHTSWHAEGQPSSVTISKAAVRARFAQGLVLTCACLLTPAPCHGHKWTFQRQRSEMALLCVGSMSGIPGCFAKVHYCSCPC